MTNRQLQQILAKHPPESRVEIRLVNMIESGGDIVPEILQSEISTVVPSRDHRNRLILQVTNET